LTAEGSRSRPRETTNPRTVTPPMRDFSQLLDGLVYTRSRNAKLKLIGDYL
jgi:DNA ligase-1